MPEWELLVHTPAVFVRVANNRLTGYGTWKSVRRMGDRAFRPSRDLRSTTAMKLRSERPHVEMSGKGRGERKALGLKDVPPTFLVSVAAKGFSPAVSLLFATLAGRCISVADKGLRGSTARPLERRGAGVHPPIRWKTIKTKGLQNGVPVSV